MSLCCAMFILAGCAPLQKSAPEASLSVDIAVNVRTLQLPAGIEARSATFIPSGRVLVSYDTDTIVDARDVKLATINDDGSDFRPFFAQRLPERPKDNGIRFMVFPDNRRIFTGDFVIECAKSLDDCLNPELLPVRYPAEVADGAHIAHRWSEPIVAPDNVHVGWTTLLADFSAVVLVGKLKRKANNYAIEQSQIVSTLERFKPDPKHSDGVIPQPVRGGEVKQFVHGGTAISAVGVIARDLPNSTVQHLESGRMEAVTDTAGYTETTIFSPDERLGVTMTTRFSPPTDLAVLGLLPRPYPASLNMGLSMFAYMHGVVGVRNGREGNVGPALIDIAASKAQPGYLGINLSRDEAWVFGSPLSWHPGGAKASFMERTRGGTARRVRIMDLPGWRAGEVVRSQPFPSKIADASSDLSIIPLMLGRDRNIDVKVYGRISGYLTYRRTAERIEKIYHDFIDQEGAIWSGSEITEINASGNSTYCGKLTLSGRRNGSMDLAMTFGPISGKPAARIVFDKDDDGKPLTYGFAEYLGRRIDVSALVP